MLKIKFQNIVWKVGKEIIQKTKYMFYHLKRIQENKWLENFILLLSLYCGLMEGVLMI